ncbi:MAG: ATP-binding protein [Planctomycetaceae bacterium]|nr:ATP-binding protein [Planctomycetaceae bacterium]
MAKDDDTEAPSLGEWRAITGYEPQYSVAAEMALQAAHEGRLLCIRLINQRAGLADDFQILTENRIDAFQVKWAQRPSSFTFSNLRALIRGLATGWHHLRQDHPALRVVVHVYTNHPASVNDSVKHSSGEKIGSFFDFRADILEVMRRGGAPKEATIKKWEAPLRDLQIESGLDAQEFDEFLRDLCVDVGQTLVSERTDPLDLSPPRTRTSDVEKLKAYLLKRVREEHRGFTVEISCSELLAGAGLDDRLDLRNRHVFPPPDIQYSPLANTRDDLAQRLRRLPGGYLSLVGAPGSGKSTLINEEFTDPALRVLRYYSFIPGTDLSGHIRGESEHFLHDINLSLRRLGASGYSRQLDVALDPKSEFLKQIACLNEEFSRTGRRTIIFVDGLDHIPREQQPQRSLLCDLPLPNQVPDGVFVVLGTQTVELSDLPRQVRLEIFKAERRVDMSRLTAPQVSDITAVEYPEDVRTQALAKRLFALSDGHPLALAILIRLLRQSRVTIADAVSCLDDIDFVGTDIDQYYATVWDQLDPDDETFDFFGRACRDRLPIRINSSETDLGRSRFASLRRQVQHLFQEDPSGQLHFFHNSFRLFLRRVTSNNIAGHFDESRHLGYHRDLAHRYANSPDPLDRWEVVYHHWKANCVQRAMEFVTLESAREQVHHFRPPDALFPDLRVLLQLAFETANLPKVAEIALIWNELNLCGYAMNDQYDSIARELVLAGEVRTAIRLLMDGTAVRLKAATCLDAAVTLSEMGHDKVARALFFAAEPLSQLHQFNEVIDETERKVLVQWARTASRFRRPQQVLTMIRTAALQTAFHTGHRSDPETIRDELLIAFAGSISGHPEESLIDDVDREMRPRSRAAWLRLRNARIHALPRGDDRRGSLAESVVEAYENVSPTEMTTPERLLVAEIASFLCNNQQAAKRVLKEFAPTQSNVFPHENALTQVQMNWFRLFRLRGSLGERVDIKEIEIDEENQFVRALGFVTRHIATFGLLAAKRFRHELSTDELLQAVRSTMRFMDGGASNADVDDVHRHIRPLRPAVAQLVLRHLVDNESIEQVADMLIDAATGMSSIPSWTAFESLSLFHHLREAGVDSNVCREFLDRIEREWRPDSEDASMRAEREVRLAKARNQLGDHECAITHLRAAVETQGTVEHSEDYQLGTACHFLVKANRTDPDEVRRRRRSELLVKTSMAGALTSAPSGGAAEAAIIDACRWNPMEAAALTRHLAESGAISFADAAGSFLKEAVHHDESCAKLALSITKAFLTPLGSPMRGLLQAIGKAGEGSVSFESLSERVECFALPERRYSWQREIVDASTASRIAVPDSAFLFTEEVDAQYGGGRHPSRVTVAPDEHLDVTEVCRTVRSPEDFRQFRARYSSPGWPHTDALTRDLCYRWSVAQVAQLARTVLEYDEDGREVMICAEALEARGDPGQAVEIARLVLENCGRNYGDDWLSGGALLRAMRLLERHLPHEEFRSAILASLCRYVKSGRSFSMRSEELFAEIFPRLCDEETLLAIAHHVERFLQYSSRFAKDEESWHRDNGTVRQALLWFVADRLSDPVNLLSDAARYVVAELILTHELHEKDLLYVCDCIDGDRRAVRGFLGALRAAVPHEPEIVRSLTHWIHGVCQVRDFGLRAEGRIILNEIGESASTEPDDDTSLLHGFTGQPLIVPPSVFEKEIDATGCLRDTYDATEFTKLAQYPIKALSRAAKIEESGLIRRVYEIAVSFGRETWERQAELALRERLDNSSLRFPFTRLRSIALENSLHRAAAELIDAGRLDAQNVSYMLPFFRISDPVLLRLPTISMPKELAAFRPDDSSSEQLREWLAACEGGIREIQHLIAHEVEESCVLAEYSHFCAGRRRCVEERFTNLWVAQPATDKPPLPFPFDPFSYASWYDQAHSDEGAVAVRHFGAIEHHGVHSEWLCLNAHAAAALGFWPDPERAFGWTDGTDFIWTVRWLNGHPDVPPSQDEQSDGWLLLGTPGVPAKMANSFDSVRQFCVVRRTIGEQAKGESSTAQWYDSFPM